MFPSVARMARLLLLILALNASLFGATRPPNIVLIFVDDMGYADIGPFGATLSTPNFDRVAREGRKFTNFHVTSAVCSASRAALLTGCYHNRVGVAGAFGPNSRIGLNPGETTIAELVKTRGYATGMAGKWHLGDKAPFLPTRQGFDEWFGIPYSGDMWPHHPEAKPGTYPRLPLFEGDKIIDEEITPEEQRQLTTQYTERAVAFIERHKDRPFFFYLAHNQPHVPLFVSDKFHGKSGAGLFGDVIQEIDWSVGQILGALERTGIAENTWIIFTSDNGPWLSYGDHAGSAGHLREGKGTSWEGGTRVPCLMRWPGKIPAGSECSIRLSTIDLLPTIAAQIGAPLPERQLDGRDVWPVLVGGPDAKNPHAAYATYYGDNRLEAVTDGRWKLVFPHTYRSIQGVPKATGGIPSKYRQQSITTAQLFDLEKDPSETTDVAAANPDVVTRLQAAAEKFRAELGDSLTKRPPTKARLPGIL
jgi:arylsulfatase A